MPFIPACHRRREKLFGVGRPVALDRNAKARIMHLARCLSRRTETRQGLRRGSQPRPSRCSKRSCGPSTTPRAGSVSRPMSASPRPPAALGARSPRPSPRLGGRGRPLLGQPHQAHPRALRRPLGQSQLALAGGADEQRLQLPRPGRRWKRRGEIRRGFFQVRKADWNRKSSYPSS